MPVDSKATKTYLGKYFKTKAGELSLRFNLIILDPAIGDFEILSFSNRFGPSDLIQIF